MKAMILAAGLGTRLRPLTDDCPKALVEIWGRTLLEITIARLKSFGIREIIVNVHHFADMMIDYLKAHQNFGIHIEVSREEVLLDTGGGLKKAAWFFLDKHTDEPFVVHNVDVISDIDLQKIVDSHRERKALATVAVQKRQTSRYLLFDEKGELCGRQVGNHEPEIARTTNSAQPLAFTGIHVISPRFLKLMTEEGIFSVIGPYLRLAAEGEKITAFRADQFYWKDLGKPANLTCAAKDIEEGRLICR